MLDPRTTPLNSRLAGERLRGQCNAPRFVTPSLARITAATGDLLDAPNGSRIRQCLYGTLVQLYEIHQGYAFIQSQRDGYVGYILQNAVTPLSEAPPPQQLYRAHAHATQLYTHADMKGPSLKTLPFGAEFIVTDQSQGFFQTLDGFVPCQHLSPAQNTASCPVAIAQLFEGTPYLWGGNSVFGIDCSGLTQAAWQTCGLNCPADSDMQARDFGSPLPDDAGLIGGDLIFWPGHVGLMVDSEHIIHANAFHMSTTVEPLHEVRQRILHSEQHNISTRRRAAHLLTP